MSIFPNYNKEQTTKISLNYLPNGKVFKQRFNNVSNLYKFFKGLSQDFKDFNEDLNSFYDALFVKEDLGLIEEYEKDFGIPDKVFLNLGSTLEDRQKDLIVKKFMMRNNRQIDYNNIADIYNQNIEFFYGSDYFSFPSNNFPLIFNHIFEYSNSQLNNILIIKFLDATSNGFNITFPFTFGVSDETVLKLIRIFEEIRPITTKIIYVDSQNDEINL